MKTGIVLEGGAVRTIFSTGVCDALLTRDLLPDYVIGVSAGIAYGVSYVSKQSRRNLDIMVNYINDKRYMGFGNLLDVYKRQVIALSLMGVGGGGAIPWMIFAQVVFGLGLGAAVAGLSILVLRRLTLSDGLDTIFVVAAALLLSLIHI